MKKPRQELELDRIERLATELAKATRRFNKTRRRRPRERSECGRLIGQRIRAHRRAMPSSQRALAARLGVSQSWVALAERGRRPPPHRLAKLAEIFGVKLDDLLEEE